MKRIFAVIFLVFLFIPGIFFSNAALSTEQPGQTQKQISIYFVRHAWHAGIIFRTSDIDTMPVMAEFTDATYLEVGWGDADYYMNRSPGFWITFKAAILPTMSTLHVVGFDRDVTEFFPGTDIVRLDLSRQELTRLISFINEAFALDARGYPIKLDSGLYGRSYFYKGSQHYYAFKNCNTWMARALSEAGKPISPLTTLTVNQLLVRLKEHGTIIQETDT